MVTKGINFVAGVTGMVFAFAGPNAPNGFLLCDGSVKNRADFPTLFGVIGTAYNTGGETGTQFRVPDLRGRVAAGADNMGGTAASRLTTAGGGVDGATLGATGGGQSHVLTTAQMPQHNHGVNDPGHSHSASFRLGQSAGGLTWAYGGTADNASQSVNVVSNTTGITIQNNGSGQAHPNVQPTIVLNYIIAT